MSAERTLADQLYRALHDETDGDYLVGASRELRDGGGQDLALPDAGMHEVIMWAIAAVLPVIAAREARIRAELEPPIDRVRRLHSQRSDLGLAPGKWCPGCGEEEPCRTIRALNGDTRG